jgi:hypothetical protein
LEAGDVFISAHECWFVLFRIHSWQFQNQGFCHGLLVLREVIELLALVNLDIATRSVPPSVAPPETEMLKATKRFNGYWREPQERHTKLRQFDRLKTLAGINRINFAEEGWG